MIHKTINGVDVPALGFGTYRLTGPSCRSGVTDALEVGYRHIDTAQAYGNEDQVGLGIRDAAVERDELFLTTKVWMDNLSPHRIRTSVDESLSKLRTDGVDLLLIHWPTDEMDLEAVLDALLELKAEQKTRQIGVSNFTPELVRRAASHAAVFCNQVEYHPFLDQSRLLDAAREHDMLLTAYSPIARGEVFNSDTLDSIGAAHGKTPAQVALRWLIQQDHVAAIPKASGAEHRRQNFDLFDFELSREEMDRIAALSRGERIVNPAWAPAW